MSDLLRNTYYRLINELNIPTYRYLYDSFGVADRLTGLIGPRGVGKTTLLLQYIKNKVKNPQDAFYFSADHIYFSKVTLFEFVQQLYETEDLRLFFIDEIHKYRNWNQELKNLYDSFPRLKIVFSGSSSADLLKGAHDLSRRAVLRYLRGLSFREYLNFKTGGSHVAFDFETLTSQQVEVSLELSQIPRLRGHFAEYLKEGYYPFVFEGGGHYYEKIEALIEKTIFSDIASFYNLHTASLYHFKKILYFLATIPPGDISTHNLAHNLGIDDKTALHYIRILQATGLVRLLFPDHRGSQLIRKPEKVYLDNTTLLHAICRGLGQEVDTGSARELFFLSTMENAGETVFYSRQAGDFKAGGMVFEIGGKGKSGKQVRRAADKAFVVKDGILTGSKTIMPLYLFGFLY